MKGDRGAVDTLGGSDSGGLSRKQPWPSGEGGHCGLVLCLSSGLGHEVPGWEVEGTLLVKPAGS